MSKLSKHIKDLRNNKITHEVFESYLLTNVALRDFIYPKRRLIRLLEVESVKSDYTLVSLIEKVIVKQNEIYLERKTAFLNVKSKSELCSLINSNIYPDVDIYLDLLLSQKEKYEYFYIPKKTGGFRKISKPNNLHLLHIQQNLNFLLNLVYDPPDAAHGFVLEKSIITNAKVHVRKNYVLNLDIKDFFPSISNAQVISLFSSPPFNFSSEICMYLSLICCDKNQLPQGAPTSPIITNIMCRSLDAELKKIADSLSIDYSRYADDITFSSDTNIFDLDFMRKIEIILKVYGFEVNKKKYRVQNKNKRQEVTGLIVNQKLNVSRKYIRNLRATLHSLEVDPPELFQRKFNLKYGKFKMLGLPDYKNVIKGKINFVGSVRGKNDAIYSKLKQKFDNLTNKTKVG